MIAMKIMYLANILVAGWISISSLFYPKRALHTVFTNDIAYSEVIRLVGALWWAIFIISILGLFYPKQMSLIFLFQFIYKGSWLMAVAVPAIMNKQAYPSSMATCFLIWVIILPFIIPWNELFVK